MNKYEFKPFQTQRFFNKSLMSVSSVLHNVLCIDNRASDYSLLKTVYYII